MNRAKSPTVKLARDHALRGHQQHRAGAHDHGEAVDGVDEAIQHPCLHRSPAAAHRSGVRSGAPRYAAAPRPPPSGPAPRRTSRPGSRSRVSPGSAPASDTAASGSTRRDRQRRPRRWGRNATSVICQLMLAMIATATTNERRLPATSGSHVGKSPTSATSCAVAVDRLAGRDGVRQRARPAQQGGEQVAAHQRADREPEGPPGPRLAVGGCHARQPDSDIEGDQRPTRSTRPSRARSWCQRPPSRSARE